MEDLIQPVQDSKKPSDSGSNAREMALELSFDQDAFESLGKAGKKKRRVEAPAETEAPTAKKSKMSEVSGVDPVLLALQMKKNEARAIAKKATTEEEELQAAGPHALKHKAAAEEKARQREFKEKLEKAGVNPERYSRLHETQEKVDADERKKRSRGASDSTSLGAFHLLRRSLSLSDIFFEKAVTDLNYVHFSVSSKCTRPPSPDTGPSVDQYASSFARRSKDAKFNKEAYEAQKEALGDDFYAEAHEVSAPTAFQPEAERIDAMASELSKQGEKRKQFHRRRSFKEEKDITFINEANRKLNRQLDKHYGKATAAIKESLERGTAL